MSILAYDSAQWRDIRANPPAIFPYADGRYKWSNDQFPHAKFRYITVTGLAAIDIADFEPGCVWPGSALRSWAERRRDAFPGADLTVYVDRFNYSEAQAALSGFNWHLFLATLDNTLLTSFDGRLVRACQTTDRRNRYDVSTVFNEGWLHAPA